MDGDCTDRGVFLHFGDCRVKVAHDIEDFKQLPARVQGMVDEVVENYGSEA